MSQDEKLNMLDQAVRDSHISLTIPRSRIDERASGTDVPAAITTSPITRGGTFSTQPKRAAKSTITKDNKPIHTIDIAKVIMNFDSFCGCEQSGTVHLSMILIGADKHCTAQVHIPPVSRGPIGVDVDQSA